MRVIFVCSAFATRFPSTLVAGLNPLRVGTSFLCQFYPFGFGGFVFVFILPFDRTIFLIGGRFILLVIHTISFLLLRGTEIEFVLPAKGLGMLFEVYHDCIVRAVRLK